MAFDLEVRSDVQILHMVGPRANAMSGDWLDGLREALRSARQTPGAPPLVLTGNGRVFSAGMALPDLVDLNRAGMRDFMRLFAAAMEDVLVYPQAVVAAVDGHAIAGGCVLTLMCDYSVMARGKSLIGLKEVALGMGLPAIVVEALRFRVPSRSLAPLAMSAQLFDCDEALSLELVGDVVDRPDLLSAAVERAQALAGPAAAVAQVKAALVRPVLMQLRAHEADELERWLDTWFSEDCRLLVAETVAALGR